MTFSATIPEDYDTCDDDRHQERDWSVAITLWNYGDGTSDALGVHTYTAPGTYSVTAVYNDDGQKGDDSPVTSTAITIKINPSQFTVSITDNVIDRLTRGDSVTYTATTTPAVYGATYTWTFQGLNDGITVSGPNSSSWVGTMVKTGTLSVTVSTACTSASAQKTVAVWSRHWPDIRPQLANDGGNGWLAIPPQSVGDLGYTYTVAPRTLVENVVASGPNQGYNYVASYMQTWEATGHVNADVRNASSNYALHQYPECYRSISMQQIDVLVHEGIQAYGNFESHWSWGRDYLDGNPIRSEIENEVSHTTVESQSAFHDRVAHKADGLTDDVYTVITDGPQNQLHPENVYDYTGLYWNFPPYNPCP